MANEYVLVPRKLLSDYEREHGKCPDLMLRAKYRKELFALLDQPTPPSGDREAVLEEAAKVCDAQMALGVPPGHNAAVKECAAAVRALKSKKEV